MSSHLIHLKDCISIRYDQLDCAKKPQLMEIIQVKLSLDMLDTRRPYKPNAETLSSAQQKLLQQSINIKTMELCRNSSIKRDFILTSNIFRTNSPNLLIPYTKASTLFRAAQATAWHFYDTKSHVVYRGI